MFSNVFVRLYFIGLWCVLMGTGPDLFAQRPFVTEKADGIYEIKVADVTLGIDASWGARIVSLRKGNQEVLTPATVHPENFGSTLWLSPQTWEWPPYPVLDQKPYQVKARKKTIRFTSEPDPASGFQMSKTFSVSRRNQSIQVDYRITNISEKERKLAPWEVTRVRAGGISFFPTGEPGGYSKSNLSTAEREGITWFTYKPDLVTGHQKMFRSGSEGWLAHVNDGLIFIKQFPDIRVGQEAPREAEVEIYANKERTYLELENQGVYQTLLPGETVLWTVTWYLREIPSSVTPFEGNPKLVDLARTIVSER